MFQEADAVCAELGFGVQRICAFETVAAAHAVATEWEGGDATDRNPTVEGKMPDLRESGGKGVGGDGKALDTEVPAAIRLITLEGGSVLVTVTLSGYTLTEVCKSGCGGHGTADASIATTISTLMMSEGKAFETLDSLLDTISPLYRGQFAGSLMAKLAMLANEEDDDDDEEEKENHD